MGMTTAMNDIADLARILREQPEWADAIRSILLGQELLELPQRFAEFAEATNERLTRLETLVAEFVQATDQRLTRLESDVATLKTDMAEVKSDVATLKSDMVEVKTDVATLKSDMVEVKSGQSRLETRLDRLAGGVGRLEGAELERDVHANIVNIASYGLGLRRVRVIRTKIVTPGLDFQDAIDDAEDQGLITSEQAFHLTQADAIFAARRKSDQQDCYVVAEISRGIRDHDVIRARDRAQTLAAVKGDPVIPVVVGANVAPQQRQLAEREGVSIVLTAVFAEPDRFSSYQPTSEREG